KFAALTCAPATLLSIWRRTRPHTSMVHDTLPSTLYIVVARPLLPPPPPDAPLDELPAAKLDELPALLLLPPPLPLRVTPPVNPMVGNKPARASPTSATA